MQVRTGNEFHFIVAPVAPHIRYLPKEDVRQFQPPSPKVQEKDSGKGKGKGRAGSEDEGLPDSEGEVTSGSGSESTTSTSTSAETSDEPAEPSKTMLQIAQRPKFIRATSINSSQQVFRHVVDPADLLNCGIRHMPDSIPKANHCFHLLKWCLEEQPIGEQFLFNKELFVARWYLIMIHILKNGCAGSVCSHPSRARAISNGSSNSSSSGSSSSSAGSSSSSKQVARSRKRSRSVAVTIDRILDLTHEVTCTALKHKVT